MCERLKVFLALAAVLLLGVGCRVSPEFRGDARRASELLDEFIALHDEKRDAELG